MCKVKKISKDLQIPEQDILWRYLPCYGRNCNGNPQVDDSVCEYCTGVVCKN